MSRCPSELALEAHLLRPVAEVAAHLAGCPRCTERLRRMELAGEEFRNAVYPATVGAVRRAADSRRRQRAWVWLAPLPALAAAVLVVLVGRTPTPGPGYLGVKGNPLGFTVFAAADGGAQPVSSGQEVSATAALRFWVKPSGPCWLWVASVDVAGHVSRLFPAQGAAPARVAAAGALPGGAVLDGNAGPERMYAVCTREELSWETLERLVQSAATSGEPGVRSAGELRDLPEGAAQATVMLEKRR